MILYFENDMDNQRKARLAVINISAADWENDMLSVDVLHFKEDWLDNYTTDFMATHVQLDELLTSHDQSHLLINIARIRRRGGNIASEIERLHLLVSDIQEVFHLSRPFD